MRNRLIRHLGQPTRWALPFVALTLTAAAQEADALTPEKLNEAIDAVQTNANIPWTIVAAALVFWM